MLGLKVQKILLENRYANRRPSKMNQLAAAMDISYKHLRDLIMRGRPEDVERIAKGLGVEPAQLS